MPQGAFVSSQLFAICCVVVTYRRVSSLILQSDGQVAPLSESTRASLRKRTYVEVSSSALVRAPTHVGVHAGSYAACGRAHRGRCMAPQDHTAKFPDAHEGDELEAFLASHRDIAHAFLWTGKGHRDRLLEELWGVAIRSTWEPTSDSLACSIPIPGVGSQCGPKVAASQTIAKTRSS